MIHTIRLKGLRGGAVALDIFEGSRRCLGRGGLAGGTYMIWIVG